MADKSTPTKEERGIEKLQARVGELSTRLAESRRLMLQYCPEYLDKDGNIKPKNERKKIDKEKKPRPPVTSVKRTKALDKSVLCNFGKTAKGRNVITRQLTKTALELDNFEFNNPLTTERYQFKKDEFIKCYGCNKICASTHPVYVYSCHDCGELFQKNRELTRDLKNTVSVVIGCRTKLGHQVTLKLLRAGSTVVGTTRYPEETLKLFSQYHDYETWKDNLDIYSQGLDLDTDNQSVVFAAFAKYLQEKYGHLDNMIFCAAQTIRVREKERSRVLSEIEETNRYGDAKFVKETNVNSWAMTIDNWNQKEMEEVIRVNSVAPAMMTQALLPLLKLSLMTPYVIFVHAREGLFNVHKSKYHTHTNMAKAALAMLTACLCASGLQTTKGLDFSIHGCDPGWISVDEYYETSKPWDIPPLDEVDGASRILYPLFARLPSEPLTRRHYTQLLN
ncbi:short-chain dehydrogenase, putative [Entamoeba invadens IP1]|uniref:Short-chain dehydrogenase, putative n=1 Tax=Entamoeba invadens IP1 TaxID=370355 RepID=A0A0A1U0W1_ENTIV|nr:short-chain dehydrogenase, putative [Entamoeba invadens IP1]ELP84528.1 short-chain dehydrogenase, putative [Entamoeba invadens IP1]|eukprot:XP_004183874.1 short-chain dehydrogenase, putative [Entamoeba invadens IP1]